MLSKFYANRIIERNFFSATFSQKLKIKIDYNFIKKMEVGPGRHLVGLTNLLKNAGLSNEEIAKWLSIEEDSKALSEVF